MAGLGYGAKAAASGAEIAEDHERSRAAGEAFVHVGTAGGFADRVEVKTAEFGFQIVDSFEVSVAFTEPLGEPGGASLKLYQHTLSLDGSAQDAAASKRIPETLPPRPLCAGLLESYATTPLRPRRAPANP